jgi:flagellar biosynthesis chaperone FliJ
MAAIHRTRIKQLEGADAELAALRDQRARIDARIASLESTRKAYLLEFASEIINGLNLSQVPISAIFAHLSALDRAVVVRSDGGDTTTAEENADDEKVETFIKITRNTAVRKRVILERCGLHWHGRDAGWTGVVGSAALTQLRDVFGDRVEKPPLIAPGEFPLSAQESVVAPLHTDEEPDSAEGERNVDAVDSETPPTSTTFFRGFPPRRQAPEAPDKAT